MMIEIVNRLNYLEDKMKDFESKNEVTQMNIKILKTRLLQLEEIVESGGIFVDKQITSNIESYGGTK